MSSRYTDKKLVDSLVQKHRHRHLVGGLWDEIAGLQLKTVVRHGLTPGHSLLDAGCGSLRAGHLLISHLNPRNYFGFDYNDSLIEAGYRAELDADQKDRCPRSQLKVADVTQTLPFERRFDFVLAFSLFTHLDRESVSNGIKVLADALSTDGKLLATFFIAPDRTVDKVTHKEGVVTFSDQDPYHLSLDEIREIGLRAGLSSVKDTEFTHPRGQSLVVFKPNS